MVSVSYLYGEDENILSGVTKSVTSFLFDGVGVLTVTVSLSGDSREAVRAAVLDQSFQKKEDAIVVFRGTCIEVRFDPIDRYKVILKIEATTNILNDLYSDYNAKQQGLFPITYVDSDEIQSTDHEAVTPYDSGDHAFLIVPGSSASHTPDPAHSWESYRDGDNTFLIDETGVIANVNDDDKDTSIKATLQEDILNQYLAIEMTIESTNPRANVVGVDLVLNVSVFQQTFHDTFCKFYYWNTNSETWIELQSYTINHSNNIFAPDNFINLEIKGYIDTNNSLDASDNLKIRVTNECNSNNSLGVKVKVLACDFYTDGEYDGAEFPITSYTGVRILTGTNPLSAGVDVGDHFVIGAKDVDVLTAIFAAFTSAEIPFTVNIDANFSGYTAKDFNDLSLMDILDYFCEKQRAHWYFDHINNILYIEKESTSVSNTNNALTESDISTYSLEDKTKSKCKSVIVYGATFEVGTGEAKTEVQVRYQYPEDSQDNVIINSLKTITLDKPFITSDTEAGRYAKNVFEAKNNLEPNIILFAKSNDNSIVLRQTVTITLETKAYTTMVITAKTVSHVVANNLITDTYTIGFQKTPLRKRLAAEISALRKRQRELYTFARRTINAPTGAYLDSDDRYTLDHAVLDTGNESIDGIKTFTSIPLLPAANPTNVAHAARKQYVDNEVATVQSNIDTVQTDVDGFQDGLKSLSSGEVDQLKNIETSLITEVIWTRIAALNQSLNTAASPTFAGLTINGSIVVSGLVDGVDIAGEENQLNTAQANITANSGNISTNTSNIALKLTKAGDGMTGTLDMNNNTITGVNQINGEATNDLKLNASGKVALRYGGSIDKVDTDNTLVANLDANIPTQKAVKSHCSLNYLSIAGTQTITGQKAFGTGKTPTIVDAPTGANHAVRKDYVDGEITSHTHNSLYYTKTTIDANMVNISGTQTITGQKAFAVNKTPTAASQPSSTNHLTRKDYVDTTALAVQDEDYKIIISGINWRSHHLLHTAYTYPRMDLVNTQGQMVIQGTSGNSPPYLILDVTQHISRIVGKTYTLTKISARCRNSGSGSGDIIQYTTTNQLENDDAVSWTTIQSGFSTSWTTYSLSSMGLDITSKNVILRGTLASGWTQFGDVRIEYTVS